MSPLRPIEELPKSWAPLVKLARSARKRAYAPYSKYLVGCAIRDNRGKLFSGCNVENASYSATLCAERVAIGKMVSHSGSQVTMLVVITSSDEPVLPCGVCLQVLAEFGRKSIVLAVNRKCTSFREASFSELSPFAFSGRQLKG